MTYCVYYWTKGVLADRIGGPWWFRYFGTEHDRAAFLDSLNDVYAVYLIEVPAADKAREDALCFRLEPPESAVLVKGPCPVCGAVITLAGKTKDGREIGSCGDAFTAEKWNKRWWHHHRIYWGSRKRPVEEDRCRDE